MKRILWLAALYALLPGLCASAATAPPRLDPCAWAARQQAYLDAPSAKEWMGDAEQQAGIYDGIARIWAACTSTYATAGSTGECVAGQHAGADFDRALEIYKRAARSGSNDAIEVLDTLIRDYDVYVNLAIACGSRWTARRDAVRAEIVSVLRTMRFEK